MAKRVTERSEKIGWVSGSEISKDRKSRGEISDIIVRLKIGGV